VTQSPRRIGILEDDADLRGYLCTIISQSAALEVAFTAGTVAEAIGHCGTTPFDLCLVDLKLPDGSGLDFMAHMKRQCDAKSLILTVLGDRESVLVALYSGADGYLLKDTAPEQLRRSIELTLEGETPVSPQAATHLLEIFKASGAGRPAEAAEDGVDLTEREVEILRLFSRGLSYREAAGALGISQHTVGDHVKAVYRKLSVHSRAEAVFEARQLGLLAPGD